LKEEIYDWKVEVDDSQMFSIDFAGLLVQFHERSSISNEIRKNGQQELWLRYMDALIEAGMNESIEQTRTDSITTVLETVVKILPSKIKSLCTFEVFR
jgi:hypothetical protein